MTKKLFTWVLKQTDKNSSAFPITLRLLIASHEIILGFIALDGIQIILEYYFIA